MKAKRIDKALKRTEQVKFGLTRMSKAKFSNKKTFHEVQKKFVLVRLLNYFPFQ